MALRVLRPGRVMLKAAAASPPAPTKSNQFVSNLNEAELQTRMYNKEMHKLRKQFAADVQNQKAAETKAQETETERVRLEKKARLEAKHQRSLEKQRIAAEEQEKLRQQKTEERKLREENRMKADEFLSSNRVNMVQYLQASSKSWITLENIDQRLNLEFFAKPTPWAYEFVPFCSPDAKYWTENLNPLHADRQVNLDRLREIFEKRRESITDMSPDDLARLEEAGLLFDVEDNDKWARKDTQQMKDLMRLATGQETIVDDEEYFLGNDGEDGEFGEDDL